MVLLSQRDRETCPQGESQDDIMSTNNPVSLRLKSQEKDSSQYPDLGKWECLEHPCPVSQSEVRSL